MLKRIAFQASPAIATAMRPYDKSLPMQLVRAREAIMLRFRPVLDAHGQTEQSWRVIRVLAEESQIDIRTLSERSDLLPASLSRILPRLEQEGTVTRLSDPVDQRRMRIGLTIAGEELFAVMGREMEAAYVEIGEDLGVERVERLYAVLDDLIEIVGRKRGQRRARVA